MPEHSVITDSPADGYTAALQPAATPEFDFGAWGLQIVRSDSILLAQPATAIQTAETQAVYGQQSITVPARRDCGDMPNSPIVASAGFQAAVIALLLLYTALLHRYRSDIAEVLTNRKMIAEEVENPGQSIYGRFFNSALVVGIILVGISVVKIADLLPDQSFAALPAWAALLAVPAVSGLTLAAAGMQTAALWCIGRAAMCGAITSQIARLRKIYFAISTVVCTPAVLLYAASERGVSDWLAYIVICEIVIITVSFLRETYALFVDKNISILHWFLYLCIVELFPVSLIVLIAVRQF